MTDTDLVANKLALTQNYARQPRARAPTSNDLLDCAAAIRARLPE
jgi:hypothetical protein